MQRENSINLNSFLILQFVFGVVVWCSKLAASFCLRTTNAIKWHISICHCTYPRDDLIIFGCKRWCRFTFYNLIFHDVTTVSVAFYIFNKIVSMDACYAISKFPSKTNSFELWAFLRALQNSTTTHFLCFSLCLLMLIYFQRIQR